MSGTSAWVRTRQLLPGGAGSFGRYAVCIVACLVTLSCDKSDDAEQTACIDGARRSCRCAGGELGIQRCEDGALERCECAAPRAAGRSGGGEDEGDELDESSTDESGASGARSTQGSAGSSRGSAGSGGRSEEDGADSGDSSSSGGDPSDAEGGASSEPSPDGGMSGPSPDEPNASEPIGDLIPEPADDAAYIFDQAELRTYELFVDPADLAVIDMQPSAEMYIPARLVFEGTEYGSLMVRYKGSNGSFQAPCTTGGLDGPKDGKCSFKLGFDRVDPEGRFFGLRKLNFHSLNSDRSMLRERLGYALFREFGVATSRAVHARVYINGEFQGLYAAVEQIDGRFTRARFTDSGEGNLYKEVWPVHDDPQRYLSKLETNEDENPSVQNMLDLKLAIETSGSETERFLDRDYVTRFIAVDRVIMNDDGLFHFYCRPDGSAPPANHNFYWYEGLTSARFWIIPWDLDHSFDSYPWAHIDPEWSVEAPCTCNAVADAYQTPASCDPLVQRFIEWIDDYDRQVDAFLEGPFAKDAVDAKLAAWTAQIEPVVREAEGLNKAPSFDEWQEAVRALAAKITSARENRGYPY